MDDCSVVRLANPNLLCLAPYPHLCENSELRSYLLFMAYGACVKDPFSIVSGAFCPIDINWLVRLILKSCGFKL